MHSLLFVLCLLCICIVSAKKCGVNMYDNNPLTDRIVGGREAARGEFPWQVSLQLNHPHYGKVSHWCGGVIIEKQWILTAAHCVINPMFVLPHPQFWKVRVGEHHLKQPESSEKIVEVSHVYYYPWYHGYDNDLALFRLKKPLEFNDYVKPICLADEDTQFSGLTCVASGWGKVDFHSKGSDILRAVEIKIFDNEVCNAAYKEKFKIPIRQFHVCAGELSGGKGTCMVSLMLNHPLVGHIEHYCGGVILNKNWILTAAHCFLTDRLVAVVPSYWTVRVGEHHLSKVDKREKRHNVSGIYYSLGYHASFNNDIALIKLKEPIEMNEDVKPVCLPTTGIEYQDKTCLTSGWGKIGRTLSGSKILKVVSVSFYENEECDKKYRQLTIPIRSGHLCAGNNAGGEGTCQGDSGGPLACKIGEKWHLIGITSFGYGCAEPNFPGVYTRVTSYLPWIRETMNRY